jgi:hypothetical protein
MAKSAFVERLDEVQRLLTKQLKPLGFVRKGRTFNRTVEDGVVQVINLQSGAYEIGGRIPLPAELAHLKPDLYGKFAVNLGVFVREVSEKDGTKSPAFIQEYYCCVRDRLGRANGKEHWWSLVNGAEALVADVSAQLESAGLPFLERFGTRQAIIADWIPFNDGPGSRSNIARIDVAVVLASKGQTTSARALLSEQVERAEKQGLHNGHVEYVRELSKRLGLGDIPA